MFPRVRYPQTSQAHALTFLKFVWNEEANAYLSEPFTVNRTMEVYVKMSRWAPVVILKKDTDEEYSVYGQSPKERDEHHFDIHATDAITVMLATPVEVQKCWIL